MIVNSNKQTDSYKQRLLLYKYSSFGTQHCPLKLNFLLKSKPTQLETLNPVRTFPWFIQVSLSKIEANRSRGL